VFGPPHDLGKAPIQNDRLAEVAEQDIRRLEVAVNDAAAMRVGHRVAHRHEARQQAPQSQPALARIATGRLGGVKPGNRLPQRIALNQPHRVERPALRVRAESVYRRDAGVIQPAGDLSFQPKAIAAHRVVRLLALDDLESDFAVQLEILGHENLAQPTFGVWPQHAIPASRGGLLEGQRLVRVGGRGGRGIAGPPLHALTQRRIDRQRGQTLLGIVLMGLQMLIDQGVQEVQTLGTQVSLAYQDFAQGLPLIEHPGLHCGDQRFLADEMHL
jgi:hypothetical protein